jgi:hypothetical protein
MTLRTLASAATLLLALSPLSIASAQSSAEEVYVFETVDSYDLESNVWLKVTGILKGEAAPRTIAVTASYSGAYEQHVRACERLALMAMSKPGQYYFELRRASYSPLPLNGCKLTRR